LDSGQRDPAFPSGVPGGGKLTEWNGRYYVGTNTLVRRIFPTGAWDDDFILMNDGPYFSSLQGGDYHVYPDGRILMSGVHGLSDTVRGFTGLHCLIWFSNQGYLDTTQTHRKCLGSLDRFMELPDGRFIGSGSTGTWDGLPASNIIRFHADGALDTTFQANVWWGQAYGFLPLDDGRVYAAGLFRITGLQDTLHLVRFMPDGSLDPTFNNTIKFRAVEQTAAYGAVPGGIHPLGDDRLIITGGFDLVEDQARRGICLVDTSGQLSDDHFTGPGCGVYTYQGFNHGSIERILPAPDGSWYIYGAYHGYDDGTTNDPQQRMISRLHGLEVGITPLSTGDGPGVRVYPNPGHDRVRFSGLERGTWQVRVLDARGVLVLQGNLREAQELDVSVLPPGFYSMALHGPQGRTYRVKWARE
jgi:hypothetical protein